jgi:hypothetical protein
LYPNTLIQVIYVKSQLGRRASLYLIVNQVSLELIESVIYSRVKPQLAAQVKAGFRENLISRYDRYPLTGRWSDRNTGIPGS